MSPHSVRHLSLNLLLYKNVIEYTIMSHYTVGYHDNYNGLHEICEYADDAYHAIKQAEEDLTGFNSPHKAEYCIRED